MLGDDQLKVFRIFRLLRVLRPLRVISRNEGLQLALRTLVKATPNLMNLSIVVIVFYTLFAIFSVSLYKGRFYRCHTEHLPLSQQFKPTGKYQCLNHGGIWLNEPLNFDSFLNSMRTLFVI